MTSSSASDLNTLDLDIARTRILLSSLGIVLLWIDPTTAGGLFHLAPGALIALLGHLIYSVGIYVALRQKFTPRDLPLLCNGLDLLFAGAIALLTEGQTTPSYMFFVFAIAAVGVRRSLRHAVVMTLLSVTLYATVIAMSGGADAAHMMRAIYLGVTGYLVVLFVRQLARFEARLREIETRGQREFIARSLHDDYIQALAGVNLRLETCQQLLRRHELDRASRELAELQAGVVRQFDDVRAYLRSLAGVGALRPNATTAWSDPEVRMKANFGARSLIAEQILQIMLEGIRNARRHGAGRIVNIIASREDGQVKIGIDDDGKGFGDEATPPWTILSRVAEHGGNLSVHPGSTRLLIEMPAA